MLNSIYSQAGMAGTLALGLLLMVTVFTWLVAMAGVRARPMTRGQRWPLIVMMTVMPPSAIGYLLYSIVKTNREYRS